MISSPSRALGALLLGLTILAQPVTVTARTTPVQHYPLHLHVDRNTVSFSSSRSAFSTPRLSSPCDSVTLSPPPMTPPTCSSPASSAAAIMTKPQRWP